MEREGWIEASLGGRVTRGEMAVFTEELLRVTGTCNGGYCVFIDISRAHTLEPEIHAELTMVKDHCLTNGATRIAHAVREEDIVRHIAERLEHVMSGKEAYGLDEAVLETPLPLKTATTATEEEPLAVKAA